MSEETGVECDVAIVGAGPVGLTLAILLAQHGRSVVVLERFEQPYALPRAVHFDHEVGRILQSCGIGDDLAEVSEPADIYEWRNAAGVTLLRFGRIGASRSGWPESSMFSQPDLERLLNVRAQSLPTLEVRRGVDITHVEQFDDHAVVRDSSGGAVSARYVVGCDGANSTVRDLAGIAMHDLGFFYDWLIVDVVLDEPRVFEPNNLQICDPARPTTAVSGGPGRRRWEFMRLPDEPLDELNSEERAWELLAPWDVNPDNATLERHVVYTFQARYAEQWRVGCVLVAGDAAHQMPPFAGQGMCSGVRDAANLAWKLDHVLGGQAPDDLLDTYESERRPSASQAIDFSMELGKVICVPDPAEAAVRDEAMAAMVTDEVSEAPELPGIASGFLYPEATHAGRLFGQCTIGGERFDDVHGAGWRLIVTDESEPLEASITRWFESIGGRIVHVDEATDDWLSALDSTFFLQRPDFHLYGAADDVAAAERMLGHLRHHLDTPTTTASSLENS